MSERYPGDEELRQEAEGRRRANEPSFDEGRYEAVETRARRSSGSGGRSGSPVRNRERQRGSSQDQDQTQGLYGSQIDSSNMLGSAVAELIGTFILIFTGCAVAVAAILQRPTAGPIFYDSLAVALAFGLALAVIVAAIGHVSGAHVNPAVTLGLAATNKFSWQYVPIYIGAQLVGAILGEIGRA